MTTGDQKPMRESMGIIVLKKIWGALPFIVLVVIILVLGSAIKSKTEKLEALKAGYNALKGQQAAIGDMDRVVAIAGAAKDENDAAKKLADELNI